MQDAGGGLVSVVNGELSALLVRRENKAEAGKWYNVTLLAGPQPARRMVGSTTVTTGEFRKSNGRFQLLLGVTKLTGVSAEQLSELVASHNRYVKQYTAPDDLSVQRRPVGFRGLFLIQDISAGQPPAKHLARESTASLPTMILEATRANAEASAKVASGLDKLFSLLEKWVPPEPAPKSSK